MYVFLLSLYIDIYLVILMTLVLPHYFVANWKVRVNLSPYLTITNREKKELILSAKKQLLSLPYFSIKERGLESMQLFGWTFNLTLPDIASISERRMGPSNGAIQPPNNQLHLRILELNELDMELYKFGLAVFDKRYQQAKQLFEVGVSQSSSSSSSPTPSSSSSTVEAESETVPKEEEEKEEQQ